MNDTFADPLGGLDDQSWDAIAGDHFYSSALWLRLCALAGGARCGGVQVELPGGGQAVVPVAAVEREPNAFSRWQDQLSARHLPSPGEQGILVGARRGYLTELLGTPGADRVTVASALLTELRAVRHPDRPTAQVPCVAMYLTTPDVLALQAAGLHRLPVALTADAWIEIPPGGRDAWLDSVGSSHRARRIRTEIRQFQAVGYDIEYSTLEHAYHHVARLMARTEQRYGRQIDLDALTESFHVQGKLAGKQGQVLLCSKDGQPPIGCCLFYRSGDTVCLRAVGFEYEKLHSAAEYFNLTYYIPATFPGVRWLHAGISTAEGKALRGADLRPLWLLDLSENSVLDGLDSQIREHNRRTHAELRDSSPAVAGALVEQLWQPFC